MLEIDGHRVELTGSVLVSIVATTPTMPCVNYAHLSRALTRCEQVIREADLAGKPWSIVHDFSGITDYEMTAFTAFTHFSRWAGQNGRQRVAVIFPHDSDEAVTSNIKRIVLNLVGQFTRLPEGGFFVCQDRQEAVETITASLLPEAEREAHGGPQMKECP